MSILAIIVATIPVFLIIGYVYYHDQYDKEPPAMLLLAFVLGIASTGPAYLMSKGLNSLGIDPSIYMDETFVYALIVVAFAEEFSKFIFLMFGLYPRKAFDEPYDGILYAVMISMGFAIFENILYVKDGGIEIALLRAFTAIPAHAAFGVIMGYYIGLAKFNPSKKVGLIVTGLLGAVLVHGAYDFFIIQENFEALTMFAFVVLGVALFYSKKAMNIHKKNSPFKLGKNQDTPQISEKEVQTNQADTNVEQKQPPKINPKKENKPLIRVRPRIKAKAEKKPEEQEKELPQKPPLIRVKPKEKKKGGIRPRFKQKKKEPPKNPKKNQGQGPKNNLFDDDFWKDL